MQRLTNQKFCQNYEPKMQHLSFLESLAFLLILEGL